MKILFTHESRLARILSSEDRFLVADQLGVRFLEKPGLRPHLAVEKPDVATLEEAWERVLDGGYTGLVAVGGWVAASSAKALSLGKRGSLRLRGMLFESRVPLLHAATIPLDVGFCTTLSELSMVWDPLIPVYYTVALKHTVVLPLEEFEKILTPSPEQRYVLSRDAQLLGVSTAPLGGACGAVGFCLSYALKAPGPFLSLVLSLAALSGRTPLEVSGILQRLSGGEECPDWLLRLARRKLDYLAEHAWSYYSLSFARAGLRSRYEAFKFFKSELRKCL